MATWTSQPPDSSLDAGLVYGRSTLMKGVNNLVGEIARTDIPVLLIGESGTGKEVYARLIHRLSARNGVPLKKFSCGILEPGQLLAQLNSNLRQTTKMIGVSDTIYLDGIHELDLACQREMLSVLSNAELDECSTSQLRLITCTSRDLDREIKIGRFRRELFFRINGVSLRLPPLRERKDDIPLLMECFFTKHARELSKRTPVMSEKHLEILQSYNWPGNIRELGNLTRRIVALGDPGIAIAELGSVPPPSAGAREEEISSSLKAAARAASREAERELIIKALERSHWNRKRAAQELQISYKSLLYKIRQTGVEGPKPDGH